VINLVLVGGLGKWGKNYLSTLNTFRQVSVTIANRHNWQDLLDQKPDGVLIVTPPQSHVEIASYAMQKNIPVMCEKPLALSLAEAEELNWYSSPILVNHIHLFSLDYQVIKKNMPVNKINLIQTIGVSNNPPRDYNELWDYGPHDIAMILDLAQEFPHTVECQQLERQFTITMCFKSFRSVSIIGHATWKERFLSINDGLFVYDQLTSSDQPLTTALETFIGSINGVPDYRLGLNLSLNVMRVLDMCQKAVNTLA
jgi:predicted dehydrogenase